jgi:hypothetical protein
MGFKDAGMPHSRHSGASRNPAREAQIKNWIPAFAGMMRGAG